MDGEGEEDEVTFQIVLVTKPRNFVEGYLMRLPLHLFYSSTIVGVATTSFLKELFEPIHKPTLLLEALGSTSLLPISWPAALLVPSLLVESIITTLS